LEATFTSKRLRHILAGGKFLLVPGAYDALTARLVEREGFEVVYATGAGISNTQLAVPDIGLCTMNEILDQVRRMISAIEIPLIADIDTGFGNAVNLYRTVREFERAGAAALQIEDQVSPKRCGHFNGKQLISFDEAVGKVRAALEARTNPDLVIIARTDAIAVAGIDEAVRRAKAYLKAGADVLFVEAPSSVEELAIVGREVPGRKIANIVEGGRTPVVRAADLQAMGYSMALYANLVLRSSVLAIQENLRHLHSEGDTVGVLDRIISMEERADVTNKAFFDYIERRYVTEIAS
jgi:2-methylisocitrate lyase-like PEP mutase family enzyme